MDRGLGYRWVVTGLFWGLNFVLTWVSISLGVMLPQMGPELAMSPIAVGWLGSLSWMAMALLSMPTSLWLSRFSPKLVVGLAAASGMVFTLLQG